MLPFLRRIFRIAEKPAIDREYFQNLIQTRKIELAQENAKALNGVKCGNFVSYQQPASGGEIFLGKFLFKRDDVAAILEKKLLLIPVLQGDDEGAIFKWVSDFDETKFDPVSVPSIWGRFIYVADELVRAGESDVVCMECRKKYSTGSLIPRDDKGLPSWNFNRLKCPNGHQLLKVARLHINRRLNAGDSSA